MASRTRFGSAQAGRVGKGAPQHLLVSEPRFRRFYKMILKFFANDFEIFVNDFEIVYNMHFICILRMT